ncbi:hypothetical protein D3227_27280 [Mesorhizobium waimense]|uniref:Prohead serine protease domain-containing protein n=1 Tax=Mesorhizobium waimense TaxID=1300307 RepID=A0A3A5KCU2_9HYPH|nr:HK97 family phage prohead protease [Mesorhizobium waimense]RJT32106.1 hypothetical protein D3227_27280 [Mesorhizobium waimense]
MNRGYSILNIKSVSEDERTITGIASTPATDLQDDVVEPRGAVFKLPIPLLWQHKHDAPVGWVTSAKVTDAGIEIVAKIAKIADPGTLKDRVDEAFAAIKAGLVRGLSIGFKGLDSEPIRGTYGVRYKKWLWLELSAVTLAANVEASILSVKRADFRDGRSTHIEVDLQRAAALGKVDADISRIDRLIADKLKLLKADEAKHALDQSVELQARLNSQISTLRKQADEAQEKRFKAEIGEFEKPLPIARLQQSEPVTEEVRKYLATETAALKELGLNEDTRNMPYTHGLFAIFYNSLTTSLQKMRDRIDAIEATGQQDAYKGVYQRALPYSKGAMVTHDGSLWVSLQDVQEGTLPGSNPTSWQLAAKGATKMERTKT